VAGLRYYLTMPATIVGVMGPGEAATPTDCALAERLGERIAEKGWVTLTGGRPVGVMDAALRGAKRRNGLTIGVLPSTTPDEASPAADIRIPTGMGEARNIINVLASHVVCVCGMSAGTASEVALALKSQRHTILINPTTSTAQFWESLDSSFLHMAKTVDGAIELVERITAPELVGRRT
jgi:uncharacterized protein (TIGR00725 family)